MTTPEALLETVAAPGLEALAAHNEWALAESDHWAAFQGFLLAAIHAQITDPSISAVMAARGHGPPLPRHLAGRATHAHGLT